MATFELLDIQDFVSNLIAEIAKAKWGVRLGTLLVNDLQASLTPVVVAEAKASNDGQPLFQLLECLFTA